jgi:hypothetical protein
VADIALPSILAGGTASSFLIQRIPAISAAARQRHLARVPAGGTGAILVIRAL